MRKKIYTDDFKNMIVEVYNTGKPIKDICDEYGVSTVSVNNWINRAQPKEKISQKPVVSTKKIENDLKKKNADENRKLRKEIERIRMENEILKKAIAIFSRDENL